MKSDVSEEIETLLAVNAKKLENAANQAIDLAVIKDSARFLISNASQGEYHTAPREVRSAIKSNVHFDESNFPTICHQLVLETMRIYYAELFPKQFSMDLLSIIERESLRVLQTIKSADAAYTLDSDVYVKDIMCFTGRMIPCGMYVVDVQSGFPRSCLIKPSIFSLLPNLLYFARAGGFRRFAQVHVHRPTISEFSLAGRNVCFSRISELLVLDSELLGMMGAAWYYDPEIARISPHLAYLGMDPIANGAKRICLGETKAAREGALKKSKTRRELFEQGLYQPQQYILIWPRRDLESWLVS